MMRQNVNFPPQQLPFNRKNKSWRKKVVDWADARTFTNHNTVRKAVIHKKINYDLLNGKLHMDDLSSVLNPDSLDAGFIPDSIQHYPIMNSKLSVLRGEESKRVFDFKVVITNPNSLSEIENNKKIELINKVQNWIMSNVQTEEEAQAELQRMSEYFTYEWQDMREIRANNLLNHYIKELGVNKIFNDGFADALAVGEEIYQCDIEGGEPIVRKLDPLKVKVFRSGYSNKIEDADVIIIEDYWSPGKIIDTFYDVLSKKDIDYIENIPNKVSGSNVDSMDNIDPRTGFVSSNMLSEEIVTSDFFLDPTGAYSGIDSNLLPCQD